MRYTFDAKQDTLVKAVTYALPKPLGAAAGVNMGRKKTARPMESVGVAAHIAGAAAARPTAYAARVF